MVSFSIYVTLITFSRIFESEIARLKPTACQGRQPQGCERSDSVREAAWRFPLLFRELHRRLAGLGFLRPR